MITSVAVMDLQSCTLERLSYESMPCFAQTRDSRYCI